MAQYLVVFAVAAGVTAAAVPFVRRMAVRHGAVVHPDDRRVHKVPTPTLGGAAMFAAFVVAMAVAWQMPAFRLAFEGSEPLGVVVGAAVIFGVGFLDDVRDVSAPAKVAGQVLAAGVLSILGVTMWYFRVPFTGRSFIALSPDIIPLVCALWVVVMANAVNLVDGLDGLAAGIVAIAAAAFYLYSVQLAQIGSVTPDNAGPLIAAVAFGCCVGFLPHNFHPARIFMGDAGAMLLGLLMAATTMSVVGQSGSGFSGRTYFFYAPIFIPFFILGIPISDTAFSIVRRAAGVRSGRGGIATADKNHLHHRLMRLGHGQTRSVLILWAWTALLSALVLVPVLTNSGTGFIPAAVAALGVALYTLFAPRGRAAREQVSPDLRAEQRVP